MMKKSAKVLTIALCLAIGGGVLAACDNGTKPDEKGDKVTVTFYNATGTSSVAQMPILRKVEIDKGSTVASFTPENYDGYEFVDWFGAPSKNHRFDFSTEITEDIGIYGGFSKFVADTRDFYVIGAGTFLGGWNKIFPEYKLTKTANKNEYKITLDLTEGDKFTINADEKYHYKHGAGYIVNPNLPDGTAAFSGMGSVYDGSTRGADIKVEKSGNYTLTLVTHPNEDYNDTTASGYDPSDPTIKSVNPYDTITWVRNGDLTQAIPEKVTDYYIKGEKITNWKDMYNVDTEMTRTSTTYTLVTYLEANDQFMFTSRDTDKDGNVTVGSAYLKADKLDEASKAFINGEGEVNMVAKASGQYTFTYTVATEKLSVTFDATKTAPEYDYYLDGKYGSVNWGDYQTKKINKFTKGSGSVYTLSGVELAADDEITIRAHDSGEAELTWGNNKATYNVTHLYGGGADFVAPDGGTNIKVATAGTYDITFDSYSKIITIATHAAA